MRPLSHLYRGFIFLRNQGYERHILRIEKLPAPVISVGNITVGGSGKTPLVRFLCEEFQKKNLKPAVLTRGYKRKWKESIFFEAPPAKHITADEIGDEPLMLARLLPGVVFGIAADRHLMGEKIFRAYKPDVFILDDGFQHRRLRRNLDIVVLNAANPFDNGQCLPAGMLREPPSSLGRAEVIVINKQPGSAIQSDLREQIKKYALGAEIIEARIVPRELISISDSDVKPLGFLQGRKVFGFCGIGNPGNFRTMLTDLGAEVMGFRAFRDHHRYTSTDIRDLNRRFFACGAEIAVTTLKDKVRLERTKPDFPLSGLDIRYEFDCDARERAVSLVLRHVKELASMR